MTERQTESEEANKSDNFDKSMARSEKNKNIIKNIKNNQESKDCSIFQFEVYKNEVI